MGTAMPGDMGQVRLERGAVRALDFSKMESSAGDGPSGGAMGTMGGGRSVAHAGGGRVDPQNYDPFAAAFKHHAESEAAAAAEEVLQPIHSVGAVHRAYKQREKSEELAARKRHAAKVVKIANKVNNASSTGLSGQAGPQGRAGREREREGREGREGRVHGGTVRMVEGLGYGASTVSSLGHDESVMILGGSLDQDEDREMPQPQEDLTVLIDELDYSTYSCDELAKNEILARVRRCLTSGTTVLLRTVRGGDALDGKMLLKTLSNHHASYTDTAYIVPPIYISRTADGDSMEMELKPKKLI